MSFIYPLFSVVTLVIFYKSQEISAFQRTEDIHEKLISDILDDYDLRVRPAKNYGDKVSLTLGISLQMIENLDEKKQILATRAEIFQSWNDFQLSWNPANYSGVTIVSISPKLLWIPDILLYNNAEGHFGEGRKRINVNIDYTGKVTMDYPTILKSSCEISVEKYPFDEQICHLTFGSWSFDSTRLDLLLKDNNVDLSRYTPNGEWELKSAIAKKDSMKDTLTNKKWETVTFSLKMTRLSLYHAMYYVIPCATIGIMTTLVFILPSNINERMTVGLTLLIALSFFFLLMAENLPAIAEKVPIAAKYYTVTTILSAFAYFMTCIVLRCYFSNPLEGDVPDWIKTVVFGWIAKLVRKDDGSKQISEADELNEKKIGKEQQPAILANKNSQQTQMSKLKQKIVSEDEREANKIIIESLMQKNMLEERVENWRKAADILNRFFAILFSFSFLLASALLLREAFA